MCGHQAFEHHGFLPPGTSALWGNAMQTAPRLSLRLTVRLTQLDQANCSCNGYHARRIDLLLVVVGICVGGYYGYIAGNTNRVDWCQLCMVSW